MRVRQSTLVGMPVSTDAVEAVAKAKAAVAAAKAESAATAAQAEAPPAEAPAAEAPAAEAPAAEAPAAEASPAAPLPAAPPEPPPTATDEIDVRAPTDPPPPAPVSAPKGDPLKKTQPLAAPKLPAVGKPAPKPTPAPFATTPLATPAKPVPATAKPPLKATQPMAAFKVGKPSEPKSTEPLGTEPTQAAAKLPDAPLTPVAVPRSLGLQPKSVREVSSAGTHVEGLATRPRVRTLGPKSTEPLATEPTHAVAKLPDPLAQTMSPETAEVVATFGAPSRATAIKGFAGPPPFETTAFESSPGLDGVSVDELPGEPTHVGLNTADVHDEIASEATRPNVELPPDPMDQAEATPRPAEAPKDLPVEPTVVVHPSAGAAAQTYQVDMRSGVVQEVGPATITDAPKKKSLPMLWIVVAGLVFLGFLGLSVALVTYVVLFVPRSGEETQPTATSLPETPEVPVAPSVPAVAPAPLDAEDSVGPAADHVIPREEMESFELDRPRMSHQSVRMRPVARRRAAANATTAAARLTRANSNEAAERAWRNVLGFTPAEPDAFEGLAIVTARQGRYPEARAWAQLAVDRAHGATAYRVLGDIWRQAGHPEEARLSYRAGLLRHPNDRRLQERAGQ